MKYKDDIEQLPSCPPVEAECKSMEVWRLVHQPFAEKNFLPQALNNPKRMINGTLDEYQKCSNWALSCYNSYDNASHQLEGMNKTIRNFIGDTIAKINIAPNDGRLTPPDKKGHMDLFESMSADFKNKIEVIK